MADSQDPSGQHAEGIQHIAANTAPPGTTDTSRGTEGGLGTGAESGGVSSSSSSVPGNGSNLEQTSSQGGVIETVKSYLGYGNNGASETGQLGTAGETRNAADTTSTAGSGSGSGITGAAASAASAVGLGSGNSAAGGGLGSTSSSSGAANDTTGSSSSTGSALEAAKEKVQEVTNTAGSKPVTSGDADHKPPQPAGGKPKKLENESAIPTAGGERLGEKHWGESKIVPDNPESSASEGGISSEAGQPTQQTTDNTAKNTGGATGPPGSSNDASTGSGRGEDKPSVTDKIKDKLHLGKKE